MSSVEYLRDFVCKRLTAAADEIFGVFRKTIVEYEEEIDRQRKLLDIVFKPEIHLQRIELPQQYVYKEKEVVADQHLWKQRGDCSLDQEDPEPTQIKEELEEVCCSSQEGEQSVLRMENDAFKFSPSYEDGDHQPFCNNSHVREGQEEKEGNCRSFGSTTNADPESKERGHSNNVHNPDWSEIHCNTQAGKWSLKCATCGKNFKFKSNLVIHQRIHTGERPYVCKICGKKFSRKDALKIHMRRAHTGERPYLCRTCGKRYVDASHLAKHRRSHTGVPASTSQYVHAQ